MSGMPEEMKQVTMLKGFALFATQRSGTTAFRACINSCPTVEMYGEAFYPGLFPWGYYQFFLDAVKAEENNILPAGRIESYTAYASSLRQKHPRMVVGFDVKYSDVESNPGMIPALAKSVDVAIHLRRQNLLKTHVSNLTMNKRIKEKLIKEAEIHSTKVAPRIKVRVEPSSIVGILDANMEMILKYDRFLSNNFKTLVRLNYEDLFVEAGEKTRLSDAASQEIKTKLGIDWSGAFICDLKKQNPPLLEDTIENFA